MLQLYNYCLEWWYSWNFAFPFFLRSNNIIITLIWCWFYHLLHRSYCALCLIRQSVLSLKLIGFM
jgi:hypothetical protein